MKTVIRIFIGKDGSLEGQNFTEDCDYSERLQILGMLDIMEKHVMESFKSEEIDENEKNQIRRLLDG